NIKSLLQVRENTPDFLSGEEMKTLPSIENAFLKIEKDTIVDYGKMENLTDTDADEIIDAEGKFVLPTWVDSHTHIVYAGNREQEFVDRINGLSYEEIFERGGGILNSAKKLQETSEDELYAQSKKRLDKVVKMGTGAIEIKSGYGLTTDAELKMLRVIKRLKADYPGMIKATFLGAHAFPLSYKDNHQGYIDLLCNEMIPAIAKENLAEFVDAFLETGYFSVEETERIMQAGKKHGLKAKIHVNQFTAIDGIKSCVKHD